MREPLVLKSRPSLAEWIVPVEVFEGRTVAALDEAECFAVPSVLA